MIPARLFLHSLIETGMEEDFWNGIKAAVWFYYENYTDAVDTVDGLLPVLEKLVDLANLDQDDLNEAIRGAEADYNEDPQSSPSEVLGRRTVRTESAWLAEDDEEDQ